ncbi:helix-turn-helix domain-containing protein [Microbacterium lushaniae]|uniref:PucR family transcriptional regulator n=1 Tax=Microbacterium lushaniae TaxID=2614639 RepID=A0A5J6KZK9_9MICO|nr:helix-turn-helix domain-containing protein [Microbacterium lushaniae]QEW01646.1 PucR family transcriptional regulator [Microbacterium lushaniae]
MRISDLLKSPLDLRLKAGSGYALQRKLASVVSTELVDPRPLLEPGDLVLTTGQALYTVEQQTSFVGRVASADVAGIGFVTGVAHQEVPSLIVSASSRHDIPLIEVCGTEPFARLIHMAGGHPSNTSLAPDDIGLYEAMADMVFSSSGLTGLVDYYSRVRGYPVGVIDVWGRVIAASPSHLALDPQAIVERAPWQRSNRNEGTQVHEIRGTGGILAYLYLESREEEPAAIRYVIRLIALAMERAHAGQLAERQLLGQIIEDITEGSIGVDDAAQRLERHVIRMDRRHAIVLGRLANTDMRVPMAPLTGEVSDVGNHPVITGVVDGFLVAVLDQVHSLESTAQVMYDQLRWLGAGEPSVGMGTFRDGVEGLRWSYFEALQGIHSGPGINAPRPLSIAMMIEATQSRFVRELSLEVLQPLLDRESNADGLMPTLRTFLGAGLSVARTADILFVHRNTVRYRLQRIQELTGLSLSETDHIVQLALALQVLKPEPRGRPQPRG